MNLGDIKHGDGRLVISSKLMLNVIPLSRMLMHSLSNTQVHWKTMKTISKAIS